ncbi:ABC transporter substrate-binding protein [Bradyrhizobium sp. dw_78]|uniref:ABC transporter substrate-binding protein n=1 Tax=Bradyrhizobium sp. dw_78 TaxID=2719793 RepID=UPI001BD36180|nr:ABC transporter substrate-binding protein [Bradyrhizobium sp. dw_78]
MAKSSLSRRRLVQGALGAAAALALPRTARSEDGPIRIGHQCDLTGALASTGYWRKKATDAAVKYVNENGGIGGRQVEIVTIDTETKVDVGVLRLRQLLQDRNVDFVIGSQNGGIGIASNGICRDLGTLCLSLSRTDDVTGSAANPFIFRLMVNTSLTATASGSWMIDNTAKKWTTLYADYVWGQSHRDSWQKQVDGKGGTVLNAVAMPVNTSDPLPYISKLDRSADAVFAAVLGPDMPRVLPALRQLGFAKKSIMTADSALGNADILALKGQVEGVWGMDSLPWELADKDTPAMRTFRDAIGFDEHGREVGTGRMGSPGEAWPSWSNIGFLKQTIEGSGWKTKADTPQLIKYADAHPEYAEGPLFPQGPLTVRPQDHQAFCEYYLFRIENGSYRVKHKLPREAGVYTPTANLQL